MKTCRRRIEITKQFLLEESDQQIKETFKNELKQQQAKLGEIKKMIKQAEKKGRRPADDFRI